MEKILSEKKAENARLMQVALDTIAKLQSEGNPIYKVNWITYEHQPRKRVLTKLGELKEVLDIKYAEYASNDLPNMTFRHVVSDLCYDATTKSLSNYDATCRLANQIQLCKRNYALQQIPYDELEKLKTENPDYYWEMFSNDERLEIDDIADGYFVKSTNIPV